MATALIPEGYSIEQDVPNVAIPQGYAIEGSAPSFGGQMVQNFFGGVSAAKDLVSPNYWSGLANKVGEGLSNIGDYATNPQLRQDVSNMGFTGEDVAKSFNEGFAESPGGKGLAVLGGVIPAWNAASAGIQKYANPAISESTGISSDKLQALETIAPLGIKAASSILPEGVTSKASKVANFPLNNVGKGVSELGKGIVAKGPEGRNLVMEGLKENANQSYQAMRDAGAVINKKGINQVVLNIETSLKQDGLLNNSLHSNTISVLGDIKQVAKKGNLDLEALDQYRQLLGDVISKDTDIKGKVGVDGRKAQIAKVALDNAVNNLNEKHINNPAAIDSLNAARKAYGQYRKYDDINYAIQKSNGNVRALKVNLANILKNKKQSAGYTTEELAALKKASSYGTAEGIIAGLGKFGLDLGNLRTPQSIIPIGEGILGATMAPATIPLLGAGTIANAVTRGLQSGKNANLLNTIAGGR